MSDRRAARYKGGHVVVHVKNQKDFNKCLRKFIKQVKEEGILEEYREKSRYMKPSAKKRLKRARAKYRREKNNK